MEKFLVSARKYRPQVFNTVVGQSHITTTLKNAIHNNQLAHAFLFCGPRGVGKTTCARILAKTINCQSKTSEGEACDVCNSCTSFNEGTSLNIHELDAASNNSVDDIRNLVDQVRFAPQAGEYKVYIIDEVHMLSSSAFNAFLKTLEEPPPYAIFILATTEKHKLLPTILSRCQIFDFKRITLNDTVEHLADICAKEKTQAEKAALQVIAQKSEGCMRDALSMMDKIVSFTNGELNYKNTLEHLNVLDEDYFFTLLDQFLQQSLPEALVLYDEINKKGFEGDTFLLGMAEFVRNILVCKDEKSAQLVESIESFRKRYIDAAKEIDASWLISTLNLLTDAEITYKQSRNKKLHVEMVIIKLCYLLQALEAASTPGAATTYKKTVTKGPIAYTQKKIHNLASQISKAAYNPTTNTTTEAKLYIEKELTAKLPKQEHTTPSNEITTVKKLGIKDLKNARNLAISNQAETTSLQAVALDNNNLLAIWNLIIQDMNKDGKNASAAGVLTLAQIQALDGNSFTITVGSNVHSKVVEQYKNDIMEKMMACYNNRNLSFTVNVEADLMPTIELPTKVTAKEKYAKIIDKYPLVHQLKEQLGMELDS